MDSTIKTYVMERPFQLELLKTGDGSHTLKLVGVDEQYHSLNGSLQESKHVYIVAGLDAVPPVEHDRKVLEVGMGTGLNALLTAVWSLEHKQRILYDALEPFPLDRHWIEKLNYTEFFEQKWVGDAFNAIHGAGPESYRCIHNFFLMKLFRQTLQAADLASLQYDLVYFDAFGPDTQPALWSAEVFEKIARSMKIGGILVTYCAKGAVQRAMKSAGLQIERLPGPPGKREMIRATKK